VNRATLALLAAATWGTACHAAIDDVPAAHESAELPSDSNVCEQARHHLQHCAQASFPVGDDCNPELASQLLSTPCAAFSEPGSGKADVFADAFCASGLLYWCELPSCELAPEGAELEGYVGQCEELIDLPGCGSCAFYSCLELEAGSEACGTSGYYEGFVGPYCRRFSQLTYPTLSSEGQRWIEDVRTCLQESMLDAPPDASCSELKTFGYGAHPDCYVDTGFCGLPFADKWKIFTTVDPRHFGLQPLRTALACLGFG
jgi:hypothetical protein